MVRRTAQWVCSPTTPPSSVSAVELWFELPCNPRATGNRCQPNGRLQRSNTPDGTAAKSLGPANGRSAAHASLNRPTRPAVVAQDASSAMSGFDAPRRYRGAAVAG